MQSTVRLNNEAERTIRPIKVQQRSSGGCWRTIEGLADFAVTQSYLSTAAKWGITKLDALRHLFNGHAWLWGAPKLPDSPSIRMDFWKGEVIASTEKELLV